MTKVFVSGSRSIHYLPSDAITSLNRITDQEFTVLIGDCYGLDTAAQRYLRANNYKNVIVCHIGPAPRNNLGFNTLPIEGYYQTDKDEYMGRTADYGLAIWDGQSRGTAENIRRTNTKVITAPPDKTKCIVCSKPSGNGSCPLPLTFHPPSNPKIPVCFDCYKSGRLATELTLRGFH